MKIIKGSLYEEMTKAVKDLNGQCPCVPSFARNEDTLCICKEFKEQTTEGECHCKRYKKVGG